MHSDDTDPIPLKAVLLASVLPAILGLYCGLFISPPTIGFDPAAGLLAWLNFVDGGTWNTVSTPDPNNIAQNIEVTVTWWPPGQYFLIGLLHSAGFSLGVAALVLACFSTLAAGVGMALLSRDLGAPSSSLPWISGAIACSYYSLINFSFFWGGETFIMGLWPWIALVAWRLRKRNALLVAILPLLFLIGSFIKHSFAIYAFCILLFVWVERVVDIGIRRSDRVAYVLKRVALVSFPLFSVGVLYMIYRALVIDTEVSPAMATGRYPYVPSAPWFVANAPLLSISALWRVPIGIWGKWAHAGSDEQWRLLISILRPVTPVSIFIYFL